MQSFETATLAYKDWTHEVSTGTCLVWAWSLVGVVSVGTLENGLELFE